MGNSALQKAYDSVKDIPQRMLDARVSLAILLIGITAYLYIFGEKETLQEAGAAFFGTLSTMVVTFFFKSKEE